MFDSRISNTLSKKIKPAKKRPTRFKPKHRFIKLRPVVRKTLRTPERVLLRKKLQKFGYKNYWEYLRSPHWREFKKRYFADPSRRKCVKCGATTNLNLHHRTYIRLGQEFLSDVVCLCVTCHERQHGVH